MSKKELHEIKQEVKEKELAKLRWQWFKAYWDAYDHKGHASCVPIRGTPKSRQSLVHHVPYPLKKVS